MKLYKGKMKLIRAKASIAPEFIIKMRLKRCFFDINTYSRKSYEIGNMLNKGSRSPFQPLSEKIDEIFEQCRRDLK